MRVQLLAWLRHRDIWMDGDPGTRKNGHQATPDDVPNRSAVA